MMKVELKSEHEPSATIVLPIANLIVSEMRTLLLELRKKCCYLTFNLYKAFFEKNSIFILKETYCHAIGMSELYIAMFSNEN